MAGRTWDVVTSWESCQIRIQECAGTWRSMRPVNYRHDVSKDVSIISFFQSSPGSMVGCNAGIRFSCWLIANLLNRAGKIARFLWKTSQLYHR